MVVVVFCFFKYIFIYVKKLLVEKVEINKFNMLKYMQIYKNIMMVEIKNIW